MIANVDFVTLWNSFLTTVEGVTNVTGLFTIAAYVGLVIIIAAIVRWAWQKRKGGRIVENRDGSLLAGALIAGLILIAPKVIIPIALFILQTIVNLVIAVLNQTGVGGSQNPNPVPGGEGGDSSALQPGVAGGDPTPQPDLTGDDDYVRLR